ncbi:MAG: hypothetical protein K2K52_01945 [Paramuribaculum sp.]|nr:hypothetical protein [Paramuribaculum sp.]MDE6651582.1 hypothetical protein [Paramuribaculum sp.]
MFYQKFLLPHFMQFVGTVMALIGIIGLCLGIMDAISFLCYIFLSVGILLVAISKEKTEDEFITYLRMRSIIVITVICLIYSVIMPIVQYFLMRNMDMAALGRISIAQNFITSKPVVVLLYILLFKSSIIINSKSDEQYNQN